MKKLESRIRYIHYINNLWHLALEGGDRKSSSFFGKRKTVLQNKLIMDYYDRVILFHDEKASAQGGRKIFSIMFKDNDSDACHIPEDKIINQSKQK
jgi:hypothetical protein